MFRIFMGLFFCGGFLIAGLFAGYIVVTELPLALQSQDWPSVEGNVISVNLRRHGRESRSRFHLQYAYKVGGRRYLNDDIAFLSGVFVRSGRDNAVRYPVGKIVTVYYHPDQPQTAVLETRINWPGFIGATAVFLVFSYIGYKGLRATFRSGSMKKT